MSVCYELSGTINLRYGRDEKPYVFEIVEKLLEDNNELDMNVVEDELHETLAITFSGCVYCSYDRIHEIDEGIVKLSDYVTETVGVKWVADGESGLLIVGPNADVYESKKTLEEIRTKLLKLLNQDDLDTLIREIKKYESYDSILKGCVPR